MEKQRPLRPSYLARTDLNNSAFSVPANNAQAFEKRASESD
jgi:hypothetical protein